MAMNQNLSICGEEGTQLLKLISQHFIKPKYQNQLTNPHYLGPIDLAMLSLSPIQRGLLFNSKPQNLPSFLENLKLSLSLCLTHFYPLSGQLATQKFPEEHASWIYVDCSKGSGAGFLHASVDLTVSDIVSSADLHPTVASFFDLGEKSVNHDGHFRPLLTVQVTELLDGMIVGFTVNHAVADGTTLLHFLSTFSHAFLQLEDGLNEASISVAKKPIYRPFYPEGYGPILKLPYLEPEEFVSRFDPGPLRERIFHFPSWAVAKLKAEAQTVGLNVSSFQALSAFVWRCVIRARNLQPNDETFCTIAVNARPRIDPPLPEAYFGNFIVPAQTWCKVGELLGNELGWASTLINRSIAAQDDKQVRDFINSIVKAPSVGSTGSEASFYRPNSMLIAGSTKFDMYGPQFGLGKAVAVLAGFANKDDGKVTANPGSEDGSVDFEVCLKPHVMDSLLLDPQFMCYVSSN